MGADKALLPLGRENLLQRALRVVASICPNPVIVGDSGQYSRFGRVVEDRMPGCGPLGGIHAALSATRSDRNLILSVDTPLMSAEFLRWLVDMSSNSDELAIVPQCGGRNQPLCAVYRLGLLPAIEKSLDAGEYKVDRVFSQVPTRFLSDSAIHAAGFGDDLFENVNTPEDYELLKRRLVESTMTSAEGARR
jgi:molybdopterin-guanine dinucleotide biosynthesis protein A